MTSIQLISLRLTLNLALAGESTGARTSVGSSNLDAGVKAGLVVGLDDVTLDDLSSTNTAVVLSLRRRETVHGPSAVLVTPRPHWGLGGETYQP
jgi:hypothetical protein